MTKIMLADAEVSYAHLYESSSNPFATIRQPHTGFLIRQVTL